MSFKGAYHGSTHGSMSVSYNESKKAAFRPLLPEVYFIGLNEHKDLALIDSSTAGVILETIQGDAGVRVPSQEYMSALRQRCDEVGAQLIFDEVQVGLGRTGKMWAFEHYDVIPDILTLGKALGGGLPIGAMITSKENMALFTHDPVLGHITTFGGNPVVCAAANASLEYLVDKVNLDEVNRKGQALHQFFKEMTGVKEVRSKGLFFAVDLESAELVQEVVESCLNKGLITFWFLSCPNAFRLAPPLNLTWKELEKAKTILKSVFVNIVGEKG